MGEGAMIPLGTRIAAVFDPPEDNSIHRKVVDSDGKPHWVMRPRFDDRKMFESKTGEPCVLEYREYGQKFVSSDWHVLAKSDRRKPTPPAKASAIPASMTTVSDVALQEKAVPVVPKRIVSTITGRTPSADPPTANPPRKRRLMACPDCDDGCGRCNGTGFVEI